MLTVEFKPATVRVIQQFERDLAPGLYYGRVRGFYKATVLLVGDTFIVLHSDDKCPVARALPFTFSRGDGHSTVEVRPVDATLMVER